MPSSLGVHRIFFGSDDSMLFVQCRWLASYSAAASFRYSHYFVSLLSQSTTMLSGIGKSSTDDWYVHLLSIPTSLYILFLTSRSRFHVVNPLSIELPRSLGTVVTNWNLPMHVFLKNCEFRLLILILYFLSCLPVLSGVLVLQVCYSIL